MLCHEPDNRSRINDLLLLNYPNQALIMRKTLLLVLEENRMPPGAFIANEPTGITDEAARTLMIDLAKDFSRQADAAFAYEQEHMTRTGAAPKP